jgi:hypothetical protein
MRKAIKHIPFVPALENAEPEVNLDVMPVDLPMDGLPEEEMDMAVLENLLNDINSTDQKIQQLTAVSDHLGTLYSEAESKDDSDVSALSTISIVTESILSTVGLNVRVATESISQDSLKTVAMENIRQAAKDIFKAIIFLLKKMLAFVLRVIAFISLAFMAVAAAITALSAQLAELIDKGNTYNTESLNGAKIITIDFSKGSNASLLWGISPINSFEVEHSQKANWDPKQILKYLNSNLHAVQQVNLGRVVSEIKRIISHYEEAASTIRREQSMNEVSELVQKVDLRKPIDQFKHHVLPYLAIEPKGTVERVSVGTSTSFKRIGLPLPSFDFTVVVQEYDDSRIENLPHVNIVSFGGEKASVGSKWDKLPAELFISDHEVHAQEIMDMANVVTKASQHVIKFKDSKNQMESLFNDAMKAFEDGGKLDSGNYSVNNSIKVVAQMLKTTASALGYWTQLTKMNDDAVRVMLIQAINQLKAA